MMDILDVRAVFVASAVFTMIFVPSWIFTLHSSSTGPALDMQQQSAMHATVSGPADSTATRRAKVVEMTLHSWGGYAAAAWGHDELLPVRNLSSDRWGGTAVTAFDALDTLLLMGLEREFADAARMVRETDVGSWSTKELKAPVFEMNIRHIGGALAAFALTDDPMFLRKAKQIADGLIGAFDPTTGIAYHQLIFGTTRRENEAWCGRKSILAEAGTLQLEFRLLSELTGNPRYAQQANRFTEHLLDLLDHGWPANESHYEQDAPMMPHRGLWPALLDPETGRFSGAQSFASLSDSFYEYLLKQWILFGKRRDDRLLELYENAVEGLLEHSLRYTPVTNLPYLGHIGIGFEPTFDHLTCFVPGMLILGVMHGAHSTTSDAAAASSSSARTRWWGEEEVVAAAVDLASTCYRLYLESPTGIAPEVVAFERDGSYRVTNAKYQLRPEAVESLFYLYRFTGDEKYRDWGWNMLNAIDASCRTASGFSSIARSDGVGERRGANFKDSMESFWFAETLKYFYLLFSDDGGEDGISGPLLPLDRFVFNTEGHPLPIRL